MKKLGALFLLLSTGLALAQSVDTSKEAKDSAAAAKKLSAGVSKGATGEFVDVFPADSPRIYARWQGSDLRVNAKIRAVWIAENVGDIAPANYKIDEATTLATAPDSHGIFTLGRPEDGWAPGIYRVEFYIDETLAETVKLKITPPPSKEPSLEPKILESD